jgi:apolipoprotein N-acyltransferase
MRQMHPDESPRTLRVALVQGNIPQSLKFDPAEKPMTFERYRTLTERALVLKPELIIWPETAMTDPLRYDPSSYALVTDLVARADAPLLTGTIDVTGPTAFNAAVLTQPDGRITGIYHKIHLVPFGEYIPLKHLAVPLLKWLGPKDYEASDDYGFACGSEYTLFEAGGLQFGTVICFEDTLPDLYRRFVQRGADFMVNITNDAWFKHSPASEMQLANAVFRAAETHRPLVRVTNNGVTCVVDEFGGVNPQTRLAPFTDGTMVCELMVPRTAGLTFYTMHGDWFAGACVLLSVLGLAVVVRRKK